jgi:hypothetical protein
MAMVATVIPRPGVQLPREASMAELKITETAVSCGRLTASLSGDEPTI